MLLVDLKPTNEIVMYSTLKKLILHCILAVVKQENTLHRILSLICFVQKLIFNGATRFEVTRQLSLHETVPKLWQGIFRLKPTTENVEYWLFKRPFFVASLAFVIQKDLFSLIKSSFCKNSILMMVIVTK